MKLTTHMHVRLTPGEMQAFERCYEAWCAKGKAAEGGRWERARIWSRSSFLRELLRNELEQLDALLPEPKS